ncbi:hypothetical protein [Actinoplanes sp. N902-109]|uniref:hypothetical protein n=1 Tax=Actinoplanes sp. (strain N902-109) TaxID=649831 RepID=UPI000329683C|nr:hypothetical protein [Actinoplanes sp. N902-109]AGL17669.1 hypothetical protein L083_4159 [Actinoplanes sp. N902-109]
MTGSGGADIAEVVIGVDTHKDTHTAAVIDSGLVRFSTGPLSTQTQTAMSR